MPTTPRLREHRFAVAAHQAAALAASIAQQLNEAIAQRGQAVLAVSGGRSPIALFAQLRQAAVAWSQVTVTLVDERCVPESHADSNARLVREHLLRNGAAAARFVSWLADVPQPDVLTAEALSQHANACLHAWPQPWDVAVLGMGDDGHTASWFPASPGLTQAMERDSQVAWVRPTAAPHLRLTLTRTALLRCQHLHLAIAGTSKQVVYQSALQGEQAALPVSIVLAHAPSLDVWISD